jgi:hypothetical protein
MNQPGDTVVIEERSLKVTNLIGSGELARETREKSRLNGKRKKEKGK